MRRRISRRNEEEPVARQVFAEWKLSVGWHGGLVGGDSSLNAQPPRLTLVNVCIPSTCFHHSAPLPPLPCLPTTPPKCARLPIHRCPRVTPFFRAWKRKKGRKEERKFIHTHTLFPCVKKRKYHVYIYIYMNKRRGKEFLDIDVSWPIVH